MSVTRYRFKDFVYSTPYTPYYNTYKDHEFIIDHYSEEDELRQHVWLICVSDASLRVNGYVELYQIERVD